MWTTSRLEVALLFVTGCAGAVATAPLDSIGESADRAPMPVGPPVTRPLAQLHPARAERVPRRAEAELLSTADAKRDVAASSPVERPPAHARRSKPLASGLCNPMPGGVMAGYAGDTGLDIAGNRLAVFAIASGTLDYSEPGHTLWVGPGDTANTIRLQLDDPIDHRGRTITHVWYAHLSELSYHQREGAPERIHVEACEQIGVSGVANGSPHLHIGLLLDNVVSQRWGSFLLEHQVREVLGNYRHRQRLPAR